MKKILFFALALLMTACEKIILDEDISGKKDANVILHFTQFGQEAFSRTGSICGNSISATAATRAATDITELCSRLNIAIFDADGTKVKTVAQKESDAGYGRLGHDYLDGKGDVPQQ